MPWSYLCFWHFWFARLRGDDFGSGMVLGAECDAAFHCDWNREMCKGRPYREVFYGEMLDTLRSARSEGSSSSEYIPLEKVADPIHNQTPGARKA